MENLNSLAILTKTALSSAVPSPDRGLGEVERHPHENAGVKAHSSAVHSGQKVGTAECPSVVHSYNVVLFSLNNFLKFIDSRGREGERKVERNIDLLFHLFMHWLVESSMCPDLGLNPQPWCTGTML